MVILLGSGAAAPTPPTAIRFPSPSALVCQHIAEDPGERLGMGCEPHMAAGKVHDGCTEQIGQSDRRPVCELAPGDGSACHDELCRGGTQRCIVREVAGDRAQHVPISVGEER